MKNKGEAQQQVIRLLDLNKSGKANIGIIILVFIIIFLLVFILLVFVFKVIDIDFLNGNRNKEKEYSQFLIRVKDKYSNKIIIANVTIKDKNGAIIGEYETLENGYLELNLSTNSIIKDKIKEKKRFLFWDIEVDKKLNPPEIYSEYTFIISKENYFNLEYTDKFITQKHILEYSLIPIADVSLITADYLLENSEDEVKVFVSTKNGDLVNPLVCLEWAVGIIRAEISNVSFIPQETDSYIKKCYVLNREFSPENPNFEFNIKYKSINLYQYDKLKISIFHNEILKDEIEIWKKEI